MLVPPLGERAGQGQEILQVLQLLVPNLEKQSNYSLIA
jgi:hypothetical protein